MRLEKVSQERVAELLPHYRDFLLAAEEAGGGEFSSYTWFKDALRAHGQVWLVWNDGDRCVAAAMTQIEKWPLGDRVARLTWLGGAGLEEWRAYMADLENWARDQGAVRMVFMGRRAWQRVMSDYKVRAVSMGKDL